MFLSPLLLSFGARHGHRHPRTSSRRSLRLSSKPTFHDPPPRRNGSGLSIASQLVGLMGGRITVESEPAGVACSSHRSPALPTLAAGRATARAPPNCTACLSSSSMTTRRAGGTWGDAGGGPADGGRRRFGGPEGWHLPKRGPAVWGRHSTPASGDRGPRRCCPRPPNARTIPSGVILLGRRTSQPTQGHQELASQLA